LLAKSTGFKWAVSRKDLAKKLLYEPGEKTA
jgi:hypothetical protein